MDEDAARALLAGFVSGAAVAFVSWALLLVALARNRAALAVAGGDRRVPLPLLGIVVANGAFLAWTLLGLVLGGVFIGIEDRHPEGGPLTGNWLFSVIVLACTAGALGAAAFVMRGLPRFALGVGAAAALAFGVLLPTLAG